MKFVVEINVENSAFRDGCAREVSRLLDEIAAKVRGDEASQTQRLLDANGNTVGVWGYK